MLEATLIVGLMYFLPTVIAVLRGARASAGIFVLNLLLGWTGILWIVALIWAAAAPGEVARRPCPDCGEMIAAGAARCRFCGLPMPFRWSWS